MSLHECTRVCRTGKILTTSCPAHTKVARRASQRTASLKCSAPNALSSLPRPDDDSSWCAKFSAQKGRKRSPHDLIGLTRCEIAHIQVYVIPGDSFSARACDLGRWTRKRVASGAKQKPLSLFNVPLSYKLCMPPPITQKCVCCMLQLHSHGMNAGRRLPACRVIAQESAQAQQPRHPASHASVSRSIARSFSLVSAASSSSGLGS